MSQTETPANAAESDQRGVSKGTGPEVDCGPRSEAGCVGAERPCSSSAREVLPPDVPQATAPEMVSEASPTPPAPAEPSEKPGKPDLHQQQQQRPSVVSLGETDCLVCFHRYSASRLPKLLACQHTFCAVCLKLILRHEDQAWVISCPLCRKATVVFGGLVCSLRNKDELLGRLESPGLEVQVPCPPDPSGLSLAARQPDSGNQDPFGAEASRAAAKRLVLLLLLVLVLIVLILPFVYMGLLKWALCFIIILGLAMSAVLCCSPCWGCSGLSLPPWRKKGSQQVASVA